MLDDPAKFSFQAHTPAANQHSYAGREIEEIDVTFDPALQVLPVPLMPLSIDNPSFRASFRVEGWTIHIRREFTSHVGHQVCAAEVDREVAGDMRAVAANVHSGYVFTRAAVPGPPAAARTVELARTVAAGHKLELEFLYSINRDCTSLGLPTVRTTEAPKHGRITVENGTGFTNFPQSNPRYECNKKRSEGVNVVYEPDPDYTGGDSVTLDVIFASGGESKRHYAVEVK